MIYILMENNQLVYNEKRLLYKTALFTNIMFFFINLIGIFISVEHIERDKLFYHYIITLSSMFFSVSNDTIREYTYYQNYGRVFASIEEYQVWKKQNKSYSKYLLKCIEYLCLITLLFSSLPIGINIPKNNSINLYIINIFLMQLLALLIIFIIAIYACFFIGMTFSLTCNTPKPVKEKILTIIIDNPNEECSICLDTNEKVWIKIKCNHTYHEECFTEWSKINKSCPICREQL